MRNQSHYHSRKLQSPRKRDLYLAGLPGSNHAALDQYLSGDQKEGKVACQALFDRSCAPPTHCKLQQWLLHLHDVIFKRLALPFSLNNHGVHGVGVRKTFLVGRCSSPPSPPTGLFFEVIAGGLLVQLQTILKPVFHEICIIL